jgi:hypothetical protein
MNPPTLEIPRERWLPFFNHIGKDYTGWEATVETLLGEMGDQPAEEGLPLQGISFDPVGSDAGDIMVEVGDKEFGFMTHHIERPRAVRAADTQPGEETDIQIEAQDGTVTIVHLRPRPELPPPDQAGAFGGNRDQR